MQQNKYEPTHKKKKKKKFKKNKKKKKIIKYTNTKSYERESKH